MRGGRADLSSAAGRAVPFPWLSLPQRQKQQDQKLHVRREKFEETEKVRDSSLGARLGLAAAGSPGPCWGH